MEEKTHNTEPGENELVKFPKSLSVNDDRVKITVTEMNKILDQYLDGVRLKFFPKKQKKKLVLLAHIAEMFEAGKIYSENDVNMVLMNVWDDYVMIRRYLIEYGFLDRKRDGTRYWVTKE